MPLTTETVIVAALQGGNLRRAVELLLDSYQEELFAYCARLVGPVQGGLLYQRALALALQSVPDLRSIASLRAWLFRVGRGLVLQHHRANPHEFPQALTDGYAPVSGPVPEGRLALPAPGSTSMDPATLEVLQLSLWHGLLLAEVAQVVGRREVEVRRMASQGLGLMAMEAPLGGPPS